MFTKFFSVLIILFFLFFISCNGDFFTGDKETSSKSANGDYVIEMYSGGVMVKKWISEGAVYRTTTGYCSFKDIKTGEKIRVSGDFVVYSKNEEELENE